MGEVRGQMIIGTLRYVRERFGEDAARAIVESLPGPLRTAIGDAGPQLVESGWYSSAALAEITRAVDKRYGRGDLTLARELGRAQAFADTGRFFKWMLRIAGPRTIFTRAAAVWNNYHNTGRYVVEEVGDTHAVLRIEEWSSASDVMCRRIEGWVERAIEVTQGAHASIRETAHLERDPSVSRHLFCRFRADWQ